MNDPKQTTLNVMLELLSESRATINHLHEEIRLAQDRLADCAKQKNAECTRSAFVNMQNELHVFSTRCSDLEKELLSKRSKTEFDQYYKGREDERNEFLEHSNSQAERINHLELLYQSTKEELFDASRKCDELTKERDDLKSSKVYVQIQTELERLQAKVNKLTAELQDVYGALGKARTERDELRKEKEHYEKVAQEMTNQLSDIKQKHSHWAHGHAVGHANALAKVQDAVLKLRE